MSITTAAETAELFPPIHAQPAFMVATTNLVNIATRQETTEQPRRDETPRNRKQTPIFLPNGSHTWLKS